MSGISRRDLLRTGLKGAAAFGALGAVDLGMFVRGAVAQGAEPFAGIRNLAKPLFAAPAMLTPGAQLDVALKTAGSKLLKASLVTEKGEITLSPEESAGGWIAPLPAAAGPGLYDLRVTVSPGGGAPEETETAPRAVSVYSEFKDDFDFVFITDIHFGEHQGKAPDEVLTPDMKQYYTRRAQALAAVENCSPEFIVCGGDLVLYPKNYHLGFPESYAFLLHYLKRPLHVMPGNHDMYHMDVEELGKYVRAKEYWDKYYGAYYHSFDYGKLHVCCTNTSDWPDEYIHWCPENTTSGSLLSVGIQKEQFMWMKGDLEKALAAGKDNLLFGHIPYHNIASGKTVGLPPRKMPGATEEKILGLLTSGGVKNIFVGHLHYNDVKTLSNGVIENLVRNIGGDFIDSDKAGFAVIHVRNGKFDGYDLVEISA